MSVELIKHYLRGQNLEQVGRVDEAIAEYELLVEGKFDATGPYDRLILLYGNRAQHAEVVRVADAASAHVRTYDDKKAWYDRMRVEAKRALQEVPKPVPKRTS